MSRSIHFTHHLCGQYTAHDQGQFDENQRIHGDGSPTPYSGCHAVRDHKTVSTTNPAKATCAFCRAALNGSGSAADGHSCGAIGSRFPGHAEMVRRAWHLCCRHRVDAAVLARFEREQADTLVLDEWNALYLLACHRERENTDIALKGDVIGHDDVAARLRARAEQAMTALATATLQLGEQARPAIAEVLLAAEWLEQVEAAFRRTGVLFDELRNRIEAGELDAAPADAHEATVQT